MDQDRYAAAEIALSRPGASRLDVHAGGIGLQPGENAKPSGSHRIGRSVSGVAENAIPDTRYPYKTPRNWLSKSNQTPTAVQNA